MSAAVPVSGRKPRTRTPVRYHCEVDDWDFDPRYTDGRCPICGWAPEGAPTAPAWLVAARKFEWELTGLFVLAIVLLLLGGLVAHAAGYRVPFLSSPATQAAPATTASGARTTKSPSPGPGRSPSSKASPSPSPTH